MPRLNDAIEIEREKERERKGNKGIAREGDRK
jgi:hypothetical protein